MKIRKYNGKPYPGLHYYKKQIQKHVLLFLSGLTVPTFAYTEMARISLRN